jgi:hypothetical protein
MAGVLFDPDEQPRLRARKVMAVGRVLSVEVERLSWSALPWQSSYP